MPTTNAADWTLEEVADYARRYGLTTLPEAMLPRLHELALKATAVGRTMPRQTSKAYEPAFGFTVHDE